ncbi:hypothetical protein EV182_000627 [Spiromyces aspiralis]|uniref:Uncharacterized protein n=1 Tax=Spiromyces aspiralis TaxID=68401 RepID=A0ACC1HHV1_9FUNG|nr:hypothetical protein EV182_000627 [Spiromyces aspiralis]
MAFNPASSTLAKSKEPTRPKVTIPRRLVYLTEEERAADPEKSKETHEANLLALSELFSTIKLDQLAMRLRVMVEEAERLCRDMVSRGKLRARIDQANNLVIFEGVSEVTGQDTRFIQTMGRDTTKPDMSEREILAKKWGDRITRVCELVESTVDKLYERHPEYMASIVDRS